MLHTPGWGSLHSPVLAISVDVDNDDVVLESGLAVADDEAVEEDIVDADSADVRRCCSEVHQDLPVCRFEWGVRRVVAVFDRHLADEDSPEAAEGWVRLNLVLLASVLELVVGAAAGKAFVVAVDTSTDAAAAGAAVVAEGIEVGVEVEIVAVVDLVDHSVPEGWHSYVVGNGAEERRIGWVSAPSVLHGGRCLRRRAHPAQRTR